MAIVRNAIKALVERKPLSWYLDYKTVEGIKWAVRGVALFFALTLLTFGLLKI